jgi:phenylalanyl-tRNA synthetase beta chain
MLFDIYRPQPARDGTAAATGGLAAGEKSMAVRLSFHGDGATLTDEQVDPAVRAIVDRLGADVGARLRG